MPSSKRFPKFFFVSVLVSVFFTQVDFVAPVISAIKEDQCVDIDCKDFECPKDSKIDDTSINSVKYYSFSLTDNDNKNRRKRNPKFQFKSYSNTDQDEEKLKEECCLPKCICDGCDKMKCPQDQVAINVKPGSDKPGDCCLKYECIPKFSCDTAADDLINKKFWTTACHECECKDGLQWCMEFCKESLGFCLTTNNTSILDGQSWWEEDCSHCTCNYGNARCTIPLNGCPTEEKTKELEETTTAKALENNSTTEKGNVFTTETTLMGNEVFSTTTEVYESTTLSLPTSEESSITESPPTTELLTSSTEPTILPSFQTDIAQVYSSSDETSTMHQSSSEALETSTVNFSVSTNSNTLPTSKPDSSTFFIENTSTNTPEPSSSSPFETFEISSSSQVPTESSTSLSTWEISPSPATEDQKAFDLPISFTSTSGPDEPDNTPLDSIVPVIAENYQKNQNDIKWLYFILLPALLCFVCILCIVFICKCNKKKECWAQELALIENHCEIQKTTDEPLIKHNP